MKLKPAAIRILEPFAVFGIIVGITAKIVIPILRSSSDLSLSASTILLQAGWLIGALCGFLYVVGVLRHLWQSSTSGKILFLLLLFIFAALALATPIMQL